MRIEAIAYAPAAFIRHGALPNPRDLDARGGEHPVWIPGSQPHHDALRRAVHGDGLVRTVAEANEVINRYERAAAGQRG